MPFPKVCPNCQKQFVSRTRAYIYCSRECFLADPAARRKPGPFEERFWSRVKIGAPDECWEWQGPKDKNGYGLIGVNGKQVRTHRLVLKMAGIELTSKDFVCHACDNPPCVNRCHLFVGTAKDNSLDMYRKGRGKNPVGEAHKMTKLTSQQVQQIKAMYATGQYSQSKLGKLFSCNQGTIHNIVTNKTRMHG